MLEENLYIRTCILSSVSFLKGIGFIVKSLKLKGLGRGLDEQLGKVAQDKRGIWLHSITVPCPKKGIWGLTVTEYRK